MSPEAPRPSALDSDGGSSVVGDRAPMSASYGFNAYIFNIGKHTQPHRQRRLNHHNYKKAQLSLGKTYALQPIQFLLQY